MPYSSNADLPAAVKDNLPEAAQTIWRKIADSAIGEYGDEKRAFATAWAGLRRAGWDKVGGKWSKVEKESPTSGSVHVNVPLGEADNKKKVPKVMTYGVCKTFDEIMAERIEKYNPYHGKDGRFTTGGGSQHSTSTSERAKAIVARHEAEGKYSGAKTGGTHSSGGGSGSTGASKPEIKPKTTEKPAEGKTETKTKAYKPSKAETDSIELYSSTSYADIRSGKKPKQAAHIENFISNSPVHTGTVYRGINASPEVMANLKPGASVDMHGISSWSGEHKQASSFMRGEGNKVMFEVAHTKNAADISHLSNFPHEKEVLVSAKANYKVKSVEKVKDFTIGGDGKKHKREYTKVVLEES